MDENHSILLIRGQNHYLLSDYRLFKVGYTSAHSNTCHRCVYSNTKSSRGRYKDCWNSVFRISMGSSRRDRKVCPISYLFDDTLVKMNDLTAFLPKEFGVINIESLRNWKGILDCECKNLSLYTSIYLSSKLGDWNSLQMYSIKLKDIINDWNNM